MHSQARRDDFRAGHLLARPRPVGKQAGGAVEIPLAGSVQSVRGVLDPIARVRLASMRAAGSGKGHQTGREVHRTDVLAKISPLLESDDLDLSGGPLRADVAGLKVERRRSVLHALTGHAKE